MIDAGGPDHGALLSQAVEKGPSVSLRSTASLRRTTQVRLRSSLSRAPRIWDLFDQPLNRVFQHSLAHLSVNFISAPCFSLQPFGQRPFGCAAWPLREERFSGSSSSESWGEIPGTRDSAGS